MFLSSYDYNYTSSILNSFLKGKKNATHVACAHIQSIVIRFEVFIKFCIYDALLIRLLSRCTFLKHDVGLFQALQALLSQYGIICSNLDGHCIWDEQHQILLNFPRVSLCFLIIVNRNHDDFKHSSLSWLEWTIVDTPFCNLHLTSHGG